MESEDSFLEGQQEMDRIIASWPTMASEHYDTLLEWLPKFSSFQLLANIIHYNHAHRADEYTDYREDRMFVAAEVVGMICLKFPFQAKHDFDSGMTLLSALRHVQDAAVGFLMLKRAMIMQANNKLDDSTLVKVTNKLMEDELMVRNPGLPEHHEQISAALFAGMDIELRKHFGFGIGDSILIRRKFIELVNHRFQLKLKEAKVNALPLIGEIITFRNTGKRKEESIISPEQIQYFAALKSKLMKKEVEMYCYSEIFLSLDQVYAFTAKELADFCGLSAELVAKFLDCFSTRFTSVARDEEVIKSDIILKSKPIIYADGRYIIPSFPLLSWCVEPAFEKYINSNAKLAQRYKDIKHDFLLSKGLEEFSRMLPEARLYPANLYYQQSASKVNEVDGLIAYDRTLFIIEAKGHRLTQKAKDGHYLRTENHLEQIIRDSTAQGVRVKNFILSHQDTAVFKTQTGKLVEICPNDYDDYIIVSLTLEPMGHLIPLMKVGNDLNYFQDAFPWIVSLYDLIVIADMIDHPILLLHYLKRRRQFLSEQDISIYDEIDILAYFLDNGLYIQHTLEDARQKGVSWMSFDNNSDAINDYYMFKFGKKTKLTAKPVYFLNPSYLKLLDAVAKANIPHRTELALEMLECGTDAIAKFLNFIHHCKTEFARDGKLHDCSMIVGGNELGLTYMCGPDKSTLDRTLFAHCQYKFDTQKSLSWVGIGDLSALPGAFDIQCSVIIRSTQPERYK
ncbi:hypothetical protein [Pedobacter paludis]|uniref:NERD domain-containing protein n=1 Tax=Pedobacter paludis TaxID=2203212 RepID=A0A317F4X6_9SPHI|nr:hypothetical protein [Pedobacter paludis]PWS33373.1 hypothetical protein DF947_01735 [Pedobacter paludis]